MLGKARQTWAPLDAICSIPIFSSAHLHPLGYSLLLQLLCSGREGGEPWGIRGHSQALPASKTTAGTPQCHVQQPCHHSPGPFSWAETGLCHVVWWLFCLVFRGSGGECTWLGQAPPSIVNPSGGERLARTRHQVTPFLIHRSQAFSSGHIPGLEQDQTAGPLPLVERKSTVEQIFIQFF